MPVLAVIASYLIGSVPFALILARRWGTADLRLVGSGNPGAANVLRASGMTAGLLVAALDIGKGAAGVLLAEGLAGGGAPVAAGLAAVVGHVYPVWLRFRGGKGVATACGAFSVLTPLAIVPAFAVFVAGVGISRYISVGSVLASLALPPLAWATGSPAATVGVAAAAPRRVGLRPRSTLARRRGGRARRVGAGA
jgi:glycerol-3-phosphate acyltransferase PlsY